MPAPRISAIVATDTRRTIGDAGQIPWFLPADLKYFKRITQGHAIIMGRKTFESIGRPLPKRHNIVLTRDPFYVASGVSVVHSPAEALRLAAETETEEIFIIGGEEIYRQTLPHTDRVYLTEVATTVDGGDAFFPALPAGEWVETSREEQEKDAKNPFDYTFVVLERVANLGEE
ncbi:MAG: dihydrofolate reductase [Saprospiraceae bacterium]